MPEQKYFLDTVNDRVKNTPDKVIVKSANCPGGISYRRFGDYSGRIYNYLKQHGIGKEDIVLICLPRGVRAVIAMFGVLRAGAAFTLVESTYSPDRIGFIRNDTGTKLVIDSNVYAEMMKYESIEAYEKADVHDACFAIYTSGSTGSPKGILHEYGKLDELIQCQIKADPGENKVIAIISPLNFLASVIYIFESVVVGNEVHIVSYETVNNPGKFAKYIEDNCVTEGFATPSYLKVLPYYPKCLRRMLVGGEIATDLYIEGVKLFNSYTSSEVAFVAASFIIDKTYSNTPVGKPRTDNKIFIIDDNGNELPRGQKGEICIENLYTRGYINLPEKTSEAFVDGVYHSGDIGYINENSDLVICGRKDDMIKINGNRIEPAEIENGIKKILGINNCIAKGFIDDSESFIAAYALKSEISGRGLTAENGKLNITMEELRTELSKSLPYYMIPTYFEILDEFPKNANGKVVRKDFPRPDAVANEADYIAPASEEENYFCELYARILKLKKVSADGDFYALGGDSLRAMEFLSGCRYSEITISDLYKSRTPQKLAAILIEKRGMELGDTDDRNTKALKHLQPLLSEAQWTFETQLMDPKGTMWNLTLFYELKADVDVQRLKTAIDRVLFSHPAFCSHMVFDDDGYLCMEYKPDYYKETEIINISENEFQTQKDTFSTWYKLIGTPLYRNRIYITEKSAYLFLEIYHAITDGTSLRIIREQISKAYADASYVPETDYFFLISRNAYKESLAEEYQKIGLEYKAEADAVAEMDKTNLVSYLKPDIGVFDISSGNIVRTLDISKKTLKKDSVYYRSGGNTLFMYAFLKAQAMYNGNDRAYTCWVHNGRDEAIAMNANGLLFHVYPMFLDMKKTPSDEEALGYMKDRITAEIAGGYRNYTIDNPDIVLNMSSFLYQKDIYRDKPDDSLIKAEVQINKKKESDSTVEMMLIDNSDSDEFTVKLTYRKALYSADSINRFLDLFEETVYALLK